MFDCWVFGSANSVTQPDRDNQYNMRIVYRAGACNPGDLHCTWKKSPAVPGSNRGCTVDITKVKIKSLGIKSPCYPWVVEAGDIVDSCIISEPGCKSFISCKEVLILLYFSKNKLHQHDYWYFKIRRMNMYPGQGRSKVVKIGAAIM